MIFEVPGAASPHGPRARHTAMTQSTDQQPRATTVREKPDAERVQHRPGARQVAERGHAEVQRPELLGHILPGGILCGEPGQVDRNFRRSSPFVYTSAQ